MKPLSSGRPVSVITAAARIAAVTCEPIDAPTLRTSVLTPVASPVCDGGTASTIRFAIAAKARPMPIEMMTFQAATASSEPWSRAIISRPSDVRAAPAVSGTLEPKRPPSEPETGPATSIMSAPGSISRPAPVASRPKPKPVDSGVSASCGISRKEPNMPKPTSSVTRLVIATGGSSSVGMWASGW